MSGNGLTQIAECQGDNFCATISDIEVLGPIMKYWILREFDTTLIIAIDHSWIHPLTKKFN